MKCPKCGNENFDDSLFCDYCGSDLKAAPVGKKAGIMSGFGIKRAHDDIVDKTDWDNDDYSDDNNISKRRLSRNAVISIIAIGAVVLICAILAIIIISAGSDEKATTSALDVSSDDIDMVTEVIESTDSSYKEAEEKAISESSSTTAESTTRNPTNTKQNSSKSEEKTIITEYRYRDKEFTNSTASSLSGWTQYDTSSSWSAYGSWSAWSINAYSSSNSRQVETRTTYRFSHFLCPQCGMQDPFTGPCSNCGYDIPSTAWKCIWLTTKGSTGNSRYFGGKYYVINGGKKWYWETSSQGNGERSYGQISRTEYRFRDRNLITTYYYYRWGSWSAWSSNEVYSSNNREVETRTVYR